MIGEEKYAMISYGRNDTIICLSHFDRDNNF